MDSIHSAIKRIGELQFASYQNYATQITKKNDDKKIVAKTNDSSTPNGGRVQWLQKMFSREDSSSSLGSNSTTSSGTNRMSVFGSTSNEQKRQSTAISNRNSVSLSNRQSNRQSINISSNRQSLVLNKLQRESISRQISSISVSSSTSSASSIQANTKQPLKALSRLDSMRNAFKGDEITKSHCGYYITSEDITRLEKSGDLLKFKGIFLNLFRTITLATNSANIIWNETDFIKISKLLVKQDQYAANLLDTTPLYSAQSASNLTVQNDIVLQSNNKSESNLTIHSQVAIN